MKRPAWLVVASAMSLSAAICLAGMSSASAGPSDVANSKLGAASHPGGFLPLDRLPPAGGPGGPSAGITNHFTVLGHDDLGALDTHGDVWVHGDFAYVGTWSRPCSGLGAKIVDVSNLSAPRMIGRVAAREGTSAEDVVVRHVETGYFRGDLLAVGIQRCGADPALNTQTFGVEFWDVTDPYHPRKLGELGIATGRGGVHELDLVQRGDHVYALLATPFTEWFDPVPGGDFRIVDATDPAHPTQVGEWGPAAHGLSPGPLFGLGSFGAAFGHSARASSDGLLAYVSYWDLGVLVLDISDPTDPVLLTRTRFAPDDEGEAHSVSPYETDRHRRLLLQNDEDFDPTSPTHIFFGPHGRGIGQSSPSGPAVWELPGHSLTAPVIEAANDGCDASDYPAGTAGKIAVVHTPFPFLDGIGSFPLCDQDDQERAAAAAGAVAVVHDFVAIATSPQPFGIAEPPLSIPVLFTDHATAQRMVAAGSATLKGQRPSWGFLRVFDAETGAQVAKFDGVANVHAFPPPPGWWSIHNVEVENDHAYASWYSNGIVSLDLKPLDQKNPRDPLMVGQFIPPAAPPHTPLLPEAALVWGVAVRSEDEGESAEGSKHGSGGDKQRSNTPQSKRPIVFASDMNSGLWIVEPDVGHGRDFSRQGERGSGSIAEAGTHAFGAVAATANDAVLEFGISSVTPNPAFGDAAIDFALPTASRIRLRVLDPQGRLVATLAEGDYAAGRHHALWRARQGQSGVPAGVYFVTFETSAGTFARRVARLQ